MSQIEEPDARWRAIVGDGCNSIVEWVGVRGYLLMSFLSALFAVHTHTTGEMGPLFGQVMDVGAYLFILGVAFAGNLTIAVCLYGQDGDAS